MSDKRLPILREFFRIVTRHPVSFLGAAITTAAATMFLTLFVAESLGMHGGPYLGIVTFVIIPTVFVFGLVLIPVGRWLDKRRVARGSDAGGALPVIDLNEGRTQKLVLVFGMVTIVNISVLSVASYNGIEVMETTEFCGQSCHSVMAPEYTTYQRSPHSRVPCVDCHIGPGAGWFVKSKLSGSWQLISVNLKRYPRPIPTPVHSLRPARETCEQCHWPNKFVGDRLKIITHFEEDESNTELKTVLGVRVGGRQGTVSHGIHWHVDPGVHIRYRSDEKRETMYEVELIRADGVSRRYVKAGVETPNDAAWRTMDCVDCHNRPSHIYRMPPDELDRALDEKRIDRSLPFIRREGLKALLTEYASHEEARTGIGDAVRKFYGATYPETAAASRDKIDGAVKSLVEIYSTNVWPTMNIKWGTYPSHIGHQDTPGCFRCHDGEHTAADGVSITQECDTCHSILAMEEKEPEILKQLKP